MALAAALAALGCIAGFASGARAQLPIGLTPSDEESVFSFDTPAGPIEYFAGRGLRLGHTGLTVGGFSTFEIDREEGGTGVFELDSINLLVLFEPVDFVRGFAEIEFGGIFSVEANDGDVESDPDAVVERLYGDLSYSDAIQARFGKFQTPVGRFNLVPAEPFTWTAEEPVFLERAFDEHSTGGALFGSLFVSTLTLDYWVYGQFLDPLDPESDEENVDRSVGGRLELGSSLAWWSAGVSFLAQEQDDDWSFVGGVDWLLRAGSLELTSEFTFVRGDIPDRDLWDVYLQGVYDLGPFHRFLRGLHLVGRYEHYDLHGTGDDSNLWDVGIAWIPKPYLNVKAMYRLADHESEDVTRGLLASVSVLF